MLEIKKVTAGYGKKTVLDGVSVSFERGKLTSVIGTNGCGKSTLLKVILGSVPVRSGDIVVDGTELSSLKRNDVAQRISYLSQGKNTPDMTVFQMVLHGRFPYLSYPRRYTEKDRGIAWAAMERLGICSLADKPISSLSGGMRQNVYIAMVLAQDTGYILLDEPTTYLDIAHQRELMRVLRELADDGRGIVTVMHDLPMAFGFSDEIALICKNSEIIKATPEEMSTSPQLRKAFGVGVMRIADGQWCYCDISEKQD